VAERVKFYTDEHVAKAVVAGLRRRGVDVLTAPDAGLHPADDNRHLALAVQQSRVIFTQDADFLRLHAAGVPHCGIVYAPQHTPVGHIVRSLMLIYDVLSPEDMLNHVEFL
jgi:predicted nuclease of predicted toxin-antitoxin system